jgi:hypothetical protein
MAKTAMNEVRLSGSVQLGASDQGKLGTRKFRMVGYTGEVMSIWGEAMAVDLEGITWSERPLPILLDHDTRIRVGFSQAIEVTKKGLEVEGDFLSNPTASEIVADADAGFPFQASINVHGDVIEEVGKGATVQVNGREFVGPGTIFRKSTLREVSFCALGADGDTHAEALSRRREDMAGKDGDQGKDPVEVAKAALRERLAKLQAAAEMPRQAELVLKLAAADSSLEEALLELMKDMKASLSAMEGKVQASLAAKDDDEEEEEDEDEEDEEKDRKQTADELLELVAKLRGASASELPGKDPASVDPADLKATWDACPAGKGIKAEFSRFEHFKEYREACDKGLVGVFVQEGVK